MRFEQNNPSVYSLSFHCSLLSACTPAGEEGPVCRTRARAFAACRACWKWQLCFTRCTISPAHAESPRWDMQAVFLNTWRTICCAIIWLHPFISWEERGKKKNRTSGWAKPTPARAPAVSFLESFRIWFCSRYTMYLTRVTFLKVLLWYGLFI